MASRLLLSRFVLEHRMQPSRPLSLSALAWEEEATSLLLGGNPVPLAAAEPLLLA